MEVIIQLEVNLNINDYKLYEVKNLKEYYEKYHNERGVLYDDIWEAIYYTVDLPIMPIEGQRLGTRWGMYLVVWTYWELEDMKTDDYGSKSRVVIREE